MLQLRDDDPRQAGTGGQGGQVPEMRDGKSYSARCRSDSSPVAGDAEPAIELQIIEEPQSQAPPARSFLTRLPAKAPRGPTTPSRRSQPSPRRSCPAAPSAFLSSPPRPAFARGHTSGDPPDGLRLTQKDRTLNLPVGTAVRYAPGFFRGGRFTATLDGAVLKINCSGFASLTRFNDRLCKDLALFLQGQGPPPVPAHYSMPWYLAAWSCCPGHPDRHAGRRRADDHSRPGNNGQCMACATGTVRARHCGWY